MKGSEIKFNVTLNENYLPKRITWQTTNSGVDGENDCKSVMPSIWDPKEQNALHIDL